MNEGIPELRETYKSFEQMRDEFMREVDERREELLRAFIAQHGCKPDEAILCQQPITTDGSSKFWVERKEAGLASTQRENIARAEGTEKGYDKGYECGYDHGYEEGYETGFDEAEGTVI